MTNPVLWLELRMRVRERKLWIVSALFLACLTVMAAVVIVSTAHDPGWRSPAEVGGPLTGTNSFTLLGLLLILGPLAGAGRIAQEREQRTLPGLLNTPLPRWKIAWGKLAATWCFVLWLTALGLPYFVAAALWGGVSWLTLLGALAVAVAAGMSAAAVAVGLSGFFHRSLTSYLATGALLFFWIAAWPLLGVLVQEFWEPANGRERFSEMIGYVFYYHNPVAPMVLLLDNMDNPATVENLQRIGYALGVWLLIGLGSFLLAARGLTRSLLARP